MSFSPPAGAAPRAAGPTLAPVELPLVAGQRPERRDAVRNRLAILSAAERLLADQGPESITMDRVAIEAGVGKGTVFRRFGTRADLFHALLDDTERRLQEDFIRGEPPLGPGAHPLERLVAFGEALLALTEHRGPILLASLPHDRALRYRSAVHGAYHAHLTAQLSQLELEDPDYFADVLLAALAPDLVLHQLQRGRTRAELEAAWRRLVRALLGGSALAGGGAAEALDQSR